MIFPCRHLAVVAVVAVIVVVYFRFGGEWFWAAAWNSYVEGQIRSVPACTGQDRTVPYTPSLISQASKSPLGRRRAVHHSGVRVGVGDETHIHASQSRDQMCGGRPRTPSPPTHILLLVSRGRQAGRQAGPMRERPWDCCRGSRRRRRLVSQAGFA